jgi:alanyl-tRNA synthetase
MSERLYYTDAFLTRFDAQVVGAATARDSAAVLLDRTAFYPTSGGQPSDRGSIGGIAVTDVVEGDDGRVLHIVDRTIAPGERVACEVDWVRRFDHMQQHTAQHLLSAVLERMNGIRTESFHLGAEACTIDVTAGLTLEQLRPVEEEANRVVWENRQVRVRFVTHAEAAALPLRKPPARSGLLRLIEIDGVDLSACGGTHVAATAEVGVLSVTRADRYKGGTRIEFVAGARALNRLQTYRDAIGSAARLLGTASAAVIGGIEKLQSDLKEQNLELRRWKERAIHSEADRLLDGQHGEPVVARHLPDWDTQSLKGLAAAIVSRPAGVAVLVGAEPGTVVVACGPEASADAGALVRQLIARFGGRGGGRRDAAQAGGLAAQPDDILKAAVDYL